MALCHLSFASKGLTPLPHLPESIAALKAAMPIAAILSGRYGSGICAIALLLIAVAADTQLEAAVQRPAPRLLFDLRTPRHIVTAGPFRG